MAQQWVPGAGHIVGATAFALGLGMMGCTQNNITPANETPDPEVTNRPQVVATTSVVCDLTDQLAADTIDLICLLQPGQDPHTYQARPSDRQAIDDADLVLFDGYNFAPGITGLVEASSNSSPKVAIFDKAVPDPLMGKGHDHDHSADDAHGHNEADPHGHDDENHSHNEAAEPTHSESETAELIPDPHIWHSARNNAAMVEVIAANLAEVNPDQAEFYQDNAAQLADQFLELHDWIQAQVDTVPAANRRLVTTHDSFRYFANAYGFEVKGALSGLSTEEKPSAARLTALVEQVKSATVPAIFAETTTNPDLINTVANDAGVTVAEQPLFVEGPGGAGTRAETTQQMLVANTCTIVNALGGSCDDSPPF